MISILIPNFFKGTCIACPSYKLRVIENRLQMCCVNSDFSEGVSVSILRKRSDSFPPRWKLQDEGLFGVSFMTELFFNYKLQWKEQRMGKNAVHFGRVKYEIRKIKGYLSCQLRSHSCEKSLCVCRE